ncbi:MAG: hypothetical protein PHZ09_04850 [Eubacteriales bacterium]|nr:hypothetical protein [Eubacteriales bacterium]
MKNLISVILLLSLFIACAACADTEAPVTADQTESTAADTETEIPGPDLPERDYGGYEFRSLSRGLNAGSTHWYIFDTVYFEDKAGDIVNDAVMVRNMTIEDNYNVYITMIENVSCHSAASKSILAGSDDFDIYGDSIYTAAALAADGLLVDLQTLPFIDLDARWWDANANDQLSIMHKLFLTVSDFTLMDKHGTWVTLFTKPVIELWNLDNPYELVTSNKWTLDKMYDMVKAVSHDVDGDGLPSEADSWGTIGEVWNINALMLGAGVRIFTKDEEDIPYYSLEGERSVSAFDKGYRILADKTMTLFFDKFKGTYTDVYTDGAASAMEDNRVLFYVTGMNRVLLLRGMETDFGILPNPKYDEQQDSYSIIMTYGNTNSVSVPITSTDPERTGIILEAITYESSKTSYPAYIETSIKTKYSRDEESIAMLEIIFSNRAFDLGFIFDWGGCSSFYTNLLNQTSPEFASSIAKTKESDVKAMEDTLVLFSERIG